MSDLAGLSIEGRLATPSDADWDVARAAWNLAIDQQPRAVAFVEDPADIAQVIRHAAEHGLSVTAQGTGHGAASLGPLEDTILVKTERMRRIEIDAQARTARVEAGVLAAELGTAAQEHGLCSLPGSSPDVGVIGYTLGGGLSGWGAATGLPATESPRSSSSPPKASSGGWMPARMRICSGRCAAAEAATRSSRRCTSSCCRSPISTPAR